MRFATIFLLCVFFTPVFSVFSAQEQPSGPTDEKAIKTYKEAMDYLRERKTLAALDAFKKADKQDGGHCAACRKNMIKYGIQLQEWKFAEEAAEEAVAQASSDDLALAHYDLGIVFMSEAMAKHKAELFQRAHDEMTRALAAHENFPKAVYTDGRALAYLNQDEAAKAQFEHFIQLRPDKNDPDHQRALRYI